MVAGTRLRLRRTLESGQVFRWGWEAGEIAVGVVGRFRIRLAQDDAGVWLHSPRTPEAVAAVLRYLGPAALPGGLDGIEKALEADPVLSRVLPHTRGIALLVQDPWEVLISFIISQNNNIPKIIRSVEKLAAALGGPLEGGGHAFPSPEELARAPLQVLQRCLLGYRAPYVRAAARLVASGKLDLDALRRAPEDAAREALLQVPGVGEKVADCVLLFGLGHHRAFPVDIWVRRALNRLYFHGGPPPSDAALRRFARSRFGPLAGYAQQHLYVYARAHLAGRHSALRTDRRRTAP